MVRGHTYFLARKSQCEGALQADSRVTAALAALYAQHKGEAEPTIVDGSSLWIDADGRVQLRVVSGGVSHTIETPSEIAEIVTKASVQ